MRRVNGELKIARRTIILDQAVLGAKNISVSPLIESYLVRIGINPRGNFWRPLRASLAQAKLTVRFRQVYLVENFLPLHVTIGRVRIRAVAHSCNAWGLLMLRVWRIKSRTLRFIASTLPVVVGRFNFGYLR